MICDICHQKEAVIHFTQIVSNKVTKMHFCASCASKQGISGLDLTDKPFDLLSKFLSALALPETFTDTKCPNCGKMLSEFKEDGKLGCQECWNVFRQDIVPLLKKLHGKTHQKFSSVVSAQSRVSAKIRTLQGKLQEAVKKEEFEEAARVRDEIRNIKYQKSNIKNERMKKRRKEEN